MLLLYPSKEEWKKIQWKTWYNNNKYKRKEYKKIYYNNNKEQLNKKRVLWGKINKDKQNGIHRRWCKKNPEKRRIHYARKHSKRCRELGHELLNEYFPGCEQHHINAQQVVCIPKELHRKYPHNHKKPETMVEVNRIAMKYYFEHFSKL